MGFYTLVDVTKGRTFCTSGTKLSKQDVSPTKLKFDHNIGFFFVWSKQDVSFIFLIWET